MVWISDHITWFSGTCNYSWTLRVTGLCEGNSPVTGEFPAQRASNAEMFPFNDVNMSISCCIGSSFERHQLYIHAKLTTGTVLLIKLDCYICHYMNQYCRIDNCTYRNRLQWNLNQNTKGFFQIDELQNASCDMTTILFRPQFVKSTHFWICEQGSWKALKWCINPWWRHQIETFTVLLAVCEGNLPVTGKFASLKASYAVFFDLHLNKQWWGRWFETPFFPLWRHCNA